jgi:acetyl esterase/lipase
MFSSRLRAALLTLALFCVVCLPAAAQFEVPHCWDMSAEIPYAESPKEPLVLQVITPNGQNLNPIFKPGDTGKGRGIIDVISGGWNGSKARQDEHRATGMYDILAARGYTVFCIRPGSLPNFTGLEMVDNLQRGVRWVKEHAKEYKVDPERLGMIGASAGGHLNLLSMTRPGAGDPKAADPLLRHDTRVKAVVALFPPADFLNWGGGPAPVDKSAELLFSGGVKDKTREQIDAALKDLSPALHVTAGEPPVLLIHGDADPVVPLQQSQSMEKALKDKGNDVTLIVNKGGGHLWLTIGEELMAAADWFDRQLAK